jgi:hypothetical protein
MSIKSLDSQLQQYWPSLGKEQKQSILSVIKSFLKLKDASQPSERITVEQYNKELDEAVARMDAGEFYTQEEAEKIAGSWF